MLGTISGVLKAPTSLTGSASLLEIDERLLDAHSRTEAALKEAGSGAAQNLLQDLSTSPASPARDFSIGRLHQRLGKRDDALAAYRSAFAGLEVEPSLDETAGGDEDWGDVDELMQSDSRNEAMLESISAKSLDPREIRSGLNRWGIAKLPQHYADEQICRMVEEFDAIFRDRPKFVVPNANNPNALTIRGKDLERDEIATLHECNSMPFMREAMKMAIEIPHNFNESMFLGYDRAREGSGAYGSNSKYLLGPHFDTRTVVKFFTYLSDVTRRNGPFTFSPASIEITQKIRHAYGRLGLRMRHWPFRWKILKRRSSVFSSTLLVDIEFSLPPALGIWPKAVLRRQKMQPLVQITGAKGTQFFFSGCLMHLGGEVKNGERKIVRTHTVAQYSYDNW